MGPVTIFVLYTFFVGFAQSKVTLGPDEPSHRVPLYSTATLKCCYTPNEENLSLEWIKRIHIENTAMEPRTVNISRAGTSVKDSRSDGRHCKTLILDSVQLSDSGLYQCCLNRSSMRLFTPGTYLQVYKPLEKTLNLSESTKNKILTAEGILLLLCVIFPSISLLCKSKEVNELEKKKMKKEEENIYQGLNLDDCCNTYDQIGHTQLQDGYEDVENMMEEEIEFEKP